MLPSLRIVGNDQAAIAARQGYLPLTELEAWLDENLTAADPAIQRVLYAAGTLDQDALVNLRGLLGHRSVAMRIAAQERIANSRSDSAGFVVDRCVPASSPNNYASSKFWNSGERR